MLFAECNTSSPTGSVDIATLWRAITAAPDPGPDPDLPSEKPWHPPQGVDMPSGLLKGFMMVLSLAFIFAGLVACNALAKKGGMLPSLIFYVIGFAVWPRASQEKRAAARQACSVAEMEWNRGVTQWKRQASKEAFAAKLNTLDQARAELADLPKERRPRLTKLEAEREKNQRQRYLDRFRIERAKIHGIGAGRTAMLASYGIETAADIERSKIMRIPGFGQAFTSELVQWRRGHEKNFRFNPAEPLARSDIDAIDRELEARSRSLLSALQRGPDELRYLSQGIMAARPVMMPSLEKAWTSLKIAEARLKAL